MFLRSIIGTTTQQGKQSAAPAPSSYKPSPPRVSTVADRIKTWNTRATLAQAEAAQTQLWKSRPTTPHRSGQITPFATPAASTEQFFEFTSSTDQGSISTSAQRRQSIPGGWPMDDKPVVSENPNPAISSEPPASQGVQTKTTLTDSLSSSVPPTLIAPTPNTVTPSPFDFKHRETLGFAAPAGPRTDYAYEHHGKGQKIPQSPGRDDYNLDFLPAAVAAPLAKPLPIRPSLTSANLPAIIDKSLESRASGVRVAGVHRLSESDANSPWAKFRRLDKEEKVIDHKEAASIKRPLTPPVKTVSASTPSSPRALLRPVGEGEDIVRLNITAKNSTGLKDQPVQTVARIPLSTSQAPQAVLTLTVTSPPRSDAPVQPTTVHDPPTAVNAAITNSVPGTIVVSENAPKEVPTPVTSPPGLVNAAPLQAGAVTLVPPPAANPTVNDPLRVQQPVPQTSTAPPTGPGTVQPAITPATAVPLPALLQSPPADARAILDAIILEHRAALTAISRKLSTELARLTADYDTALPSSPPLPSTSYPEPHRTLAAEVVPELNKQGKRMQDLVDEVVKSAKQDWFVDLDFFSSALFLSQESLPNECCCPAGWSAKVLQIRAEQRERARAVEVWSRRRGRMGRRGRLRGRIKTVAPLLVKPRQSKLERGRTVTTMSRCTIHGTQYTTTNTLDENESCRILPISILEHTDFGRKLLRELYLDTTLRADLSELRTQNPRCFVLPPFVASHSHLVVDGSWDDRGELCWDGIGELRWVGESELGWNDDGILEEYLGNDYGDGNGSPVYTYPTFDWRSIGAVDGLVDYGVCLLHPYLEYQ